MSAVTHTLSRWFGKGPASDEAATPASSSVPKLVRNSSALFEFTQAIATPGLSALDLGPTSPANIVYLTELGHKVYNEDVLSEAALPELQTKDEEGKPRFDLEKYLEHNLRYAPQSLDAILAWTVLEFLPESLVKPLVEKLVAALRPNGVVLAFFHNKDAGGEAMNYRYQISTPKTLELNSGKPYKAQRVFNNRHIENLFQGCRTCKFFLGPNNLREVLIKK